MKTPEETSNLEILGGDPVLIASVLGIIVLIVVFGFFFMKNYYVVYIKSQLDELRQEDNPNQKTYLVLNGKNVPVYEGPGSTTMKVTTLDAKGKLLVSDRYDLGYYHIRQFNGWVPRKMVTRIKEIEKDKYETVFSVKHNRHKFSVCIIDEHAKIFNAPSVTSRVKCSMSDPTCTLELNQEYLSNKYHDNWYYIEEVHGWIHEEYTQTKTIY